MIIQTRRQYTANLRLFLETLSVENYLHKIYSSVDEILVNTEGRQYFLERVRDYVHNYGFVPYHYCLSFKEGELFSGERLAEDVDLVCIADFVSISGEFQLLQFENTKYSFLWKHYGKKEPAPIKSITGKFKTAIKGFNGETVNLISNVRMR